MGHYAAEMGRDEENAKKKEILRKKMLLKLKKDINERGIEVVLFDIVLNGTSIYRTRLY